MIRTEQLDPPARADGAAAGCALLPVAYARVARADPVGLGHAVATLNHSVSTPDRHEALLAGAADVARRWLPDPVGVVLTSETHPLAVVVGDPRLLHTHRLLHGRGTAARRPAGPPDVVAADPLELGTAAATVGVRSCLAAPLVRGAVRWGSITLYSRVDLGPCPLVGDRLVVLGDLVGRGLAEHAELTATRSTVEQLRRAMDHRGVIEQAKGILMAVHRIDAGSAFALLSARSQDANVKVRDLAAAFVADHTTPGPTAPRT
ncbi:GAF and ANTAR domain-containing protein [Rhodococcus aerolatus]